MLTSCFHLLYDATDESKSASRHHHKSSSTSHKKSKKHKKSSSNGDLPRGVNAISEDDYFLRATEFRVWLAKTKCGSLSLSLYVVYYLRLHG